MALNKTTLVVLIVTMIGILIASSFIQPIADQETANTNTILVANQTVTVSAVNTSLELNGRQLVTAIRIYNATNHSQALSNNFLSTIKSSSDGLLTVALTVNDTSAIFAGRNVNVSYIANPDGYVGGASNNLLNLVLLFAVIGLLVYAIIALIYDNPSAQRLMKFGGK